MQDAIAQYRFSARTLCLCWLLLWANSASALAIGVMPYLSPRSLLLEFAPMREFLAEQLQQSIDLASARDLPHFLTRSHRGDFDIIITAPHFARLAQQEHGFVPLVAIRSDFYALLLVPKASPATTVRALRGKTLHLPHRLSFVSLEIEDFLRQRGLNPEQDLHLQYYSTDNNAILATEQSLDQAGVSQRSVFEEMPREIRANLRILGSTQSALALIILARPTLPATDLARLKQALQQFPYSAAGLQFFQTSHAELVPADEATMAKLDRYLPRLKQRLEPTP